ncbi:CoA pyrophosphatase [Ramlibacter monticola]|uniref:CoA pyrophosphatase n=1 Tax=Ramlibacter monticola TaxID=1926872 RepID=A0A936Z4P8_9BURK|nr:CoA pyrophosphatase [Ramlibacter monticola]MBL0395105.1 CoA pyrophosphatase [Ramlibacter monticola]
MPIDPAATIPPDTPLSKLPGFDPREVPVLAADEHLPAIAPAHLAPEALRQRFAWPPQWQPELRLEPAFTNRRTALASVLIPVVTRERPMVLLTQRTAHLSTHSGQVAFPGGKRDDTDVDAADTALREAHEEIGLDRALAEVIGELPTYTTGTMFVITPVVALVRPEYHLALNAHEVADAFEVPLDFLMDPAHHRRHALEFGGSRREWFSMPYRDGERERFIWGATAGMLRNLYRFLAA